MWSGEEISPRAPRAPRAGERGRQGAPSAPPRETHSTSERNPPSCSASLARDERGVRIRDSDPTESDPTDSNPAEWSRPSGRDLDSYFWGVGCQSRYKYPLLTTGVVVH